MNLTGQPIHQKPAPTVRDPDYLARVAGLPCCICEAFGERQASPTQVHHVIHGRHGTLRTADARAIPICEGHHQGLLDTSKLALHRAPEAWRDIYGPDTDWTAPTQDRLGV